MKVYEARFETRSGDIKTVTLGAVDLSDALKQARSYSHAPDQMDWKLCSIKRADGMVFKERVGAKA